MAREEAQHGSPPNSLEVSESVLQLLRQRLALWFGEDGVNALIARATLRASEQFPILTKVRAVPHEGRQLDRLHDRPRLHDGDWVRDAMVELLTMLFTLLGRLLGLDLVTRLVTQIWPETPNGSHKSNGSGNPIDADSAP